MNQKVKTELLEWVKTIGISLVIASGITFVVQPTVVSGQSMYPTLEDKDYLFVNKLSYDLHKPERGDIIVFKSDLHDNNNANKNLVKRIIGLPGEHIVIKAGEVYINGELLSETYIDGVYTDGDIDMTVPDNTVFTMGDNRPNSLDSRYTEVGVVSIDDIIGEASFRAYPFNKIGKLD